MINKIVIKEPLMNCNVLQKNYFAPYVATSFAFEVDEKSTPLKQAKVAKKKFDENSWVLDKSLPNSQRETIIPDPKNKRLSLKERVERLFWSWLGCCSVYNLVDGGLARFLALETLTHG